MESVYPELVVPESPQIGTLRQGAYCMDTLGHLIDGTVGNIRLIDISNIFESVTRINVLGLYQCHDTGGNQEWSVTKKGQVKHYDLCLTVVKFAKGSTVVMRVCDDTENQMWKLRDGGLIQHAKMNVCLDTRYVQQRGVTAERCNSGIDSQRWRFVQKFS